MYLIYQFSQLVDISLKVTDVAGVTHRIAQLLERIQYLQAYWERKFLQHPQNSIQTANSNLEKFEDLLRQRKQKDKSESNNTETSLVPAWVLNKVTFSAPFRQKFLIKGKSQCIMYNDWLHCMYNVYCV